MGRVLKTGIPAKKPNGSVNPFDLLLPYQKRIFQSTSKRIICCCARQVGKSFLAAAKAVATALKEPKSLTACISTGERAAKEFLLKVANWAEACYSVAPEDVKPYLRYTQSSTEIQFANGSRIIVLPSGNPAALRGYTGNIIIDEMAILDNDKEVWAAIAPLVTTKISHKDKWILLLSTPTSIDTKFAEIWNDDTGVWEKHFLTIDTAKLEGLPVDIEELKRTINDDFIWRTEYLCEFASGSEIAFPPEWFQNYKPVNFNPNEPVYLGFDVARSSDFSAISIMQRIQGRINFVEVKCMQDMPFNEQLSVLADMFRRYNVASGLIDATGMGAMVAEEAARTISAKIHPFVFTSTTKTEIFERMRTAAQKGELNVPPDSQLVTDLGSVRRVIGKNGAINYSAPHTKTGHADIACSGALAIAAEHDFPAAFAFPIPVRRNSRLY